MLSLEELLFFQWMEEQEKAKDQKEKEKNSNNGEE